MSKQNELTNEAFINFADFKESDTILELGRGLVIVANFISQKLNDGKVIDVEISENQLQYCLPSNRNLDFIQGDIPKLPFEDSVFDKVYCRYIIEHVKSLKRY